MERKKTTVTPSLPPMIFSTGNGRSTLLLFFIETKNTYARHYKMKEYGTLWIRKNPLLWALMILQNPLSFAMKDSGENQELLEDRLRDLRRGKNQQLSRLFEQLDDLMDLCRVTDVDDE